MSKSSQTSWSTWDSRIKSIRGNLQACVQDYEENTEWPGRYDQSAELHTMLACLARFEGRGKDEQMCDELLNDDISHCINNDTDDVSDIYSSEETPCDGERGDACRMHCYWIRELSDLNGISPRLRLPKRWTHIKYGDDDKEYTSILPWKALRAIYIHLYEEHSGSIWNMLEGSSGLELRKGKAEGHYVKSLDITIPRVSNMEILEETVRICEYWGIPLEISFRK